MLFHILARHLAVFLPEPATREVACPPNIEN